MYSASYHVRVYPLLVKITFPGPAQVSCETSRNNNFSIHFWKVHLVEEAKELASNVLAASLLVVHDTSGGGQNDVAELTGRQELSSPLLEVTELNGVAGVDDTTLVQTASGKLASRTDTC